MPAKTQTRQVHAASATPSMPEQLDAAYQVHTLAQLLYGQLAVPPTPAAWSFPPPTFRATPMHHPDPLNVMAGYPHPGAQWMPNTPVWNAPQYWPYTFGYQHYPR